MVVLQAIEIMKAADDVKVGAKIVQLTTEMARDKIDAVWWAEKDLSEYRVLEGDSHWPWMDVVSENSRGVLQACAAILSEENYLEGAMTYRFDYRSKLEAGQGALYVGFLATAPRNRNWLTRNPVYKGIGSTLLYWAVQESHNFGLHGRVVLQSLPTANTMQFYYNKGFVRTDLTQPTTGLVDFELPESAAVAWLKKEGDLA